MNSDLPFLGGSGDDDEAARKALLISGLKARIARGQARVKDTATPKTEDPTEDPDSSDPLGFLGSPEAAPVPVPASASIDVFPRGITNQREHLELLLATVRNRSMSVEAEAKFQAARLEFLNFKMKGEVASAAQISIFDKYLSAYLNRCPGGVSAAAGGGAGDSRSSGGNAHRPSTERPRL